MSIDIVAKSFSNSLKILGIDHIVLSRKVIKKYITKNVGGGDRVLHVLANAILLNKVRVCRKSVYGNPMWSFNGVTILYEVKNFREFEYCVIDRDEECFNDVTETIARYLKLIMPMKPLIIVDLSLFELHHDMELKVLVKQLVLAINTIRLWLTDLHIAIVNMPLYFNPLLNKISTLARICYDDSLYKTIELERAVLLDPYADEALTSQDILSNDYFIIGGIVDRKFSRPYATSMLLALNNLDIKSKSIRLGSSAIGVPNELNKIVDIVMRVRFLGESLESAIISNMSVDDKISRIVYEVRKRYSKDRVISKDIISKLMKSYSLEERYMNRILLRLKDFNII
ncbi:tRNA (guanine-N1-)-methyltransferase [Ignisphaera aggregans DSM 17230]|uniref:tRNA (Guanine-N1-)-methyltransferase n=1 Tax=Ignisphaera aggregans (strain DSM 17230 / JCM 13409 / AQ1.S1) TaxID=583356 RepID=E0SPL7_IGNAA|nr:tRNA (guanine-N1-)-methyltransferase [Ignisphaera aggregans DSM 17230]